MPATVAFVTDPPRDAHGAVVSAGELCSREACWHRWLDHDHAYAPLFGEGFGACLICVCPGFVSGNPVIVGPSPFVEPPPPAPLPDPTALTVPPAVPPPAPLSPADPPTNPIGAAAPLGAPKHAQEK